MGEHHAHALVIEVGTSGYSDLALGADGKTVHILYGEFTRIRPEEVLSRGAGRSVFDGVSDLSEDNLKRFDLSDFFFLAPPSSNRARRPSRRSRRWRFPGSCAWRRWRTCPAPRARGPRARRRP